jgi:probable HAF family extracellular repeat protein
LSAFIGCGGGGGPAVSHYTVTDLGYANGVFSINKSGQFLLTTANPQVASPTLKTYLVSGSSRTEVDTLNGTPVTLSALNDAGQLLGTFVPGGAANGASDWFLYTGGMLTDLTANLNTLFPSAAFNNSGQVALMTQQPPRTAQNPIHLMLYSSGTITDLGNPFGATSGTVVAINDVGQITGTYANAQGAKHGFLYSSGQFTDLGTLGGLDVIPSAINNQGQVTGTSDLGNPDVSDISERHNFLYSNGKMIDIIPNNDRSGDPSAMNNLGQVVGSYQGYTQAGIFAFLYTNSMLIDLTSRIPAGSGWTLERATGINDRGQIVGLGLLNGQQHAFLLTPQ